MRTPEKANGAGLQSHAALNQTQPSKKELDMISNSKNTFIAQLLAPLAESEEQADTKAFRRELWRDRRNPFKKGWRRTQLRYWIAEHERNMANLRECLAREFGEGEPAILHSEARRRQEEFIAAGEALMLCPAPDAAGLRWKQKWANSEERADWLAAIAADAARLGVEA